MHELIELYLEREALKGFKADTLKGKRYSLEAFIKSLSVPLTAAGVNDVREYAESLVKRGLSTDTVRITLAQLQAFYGFLREEGLTLTNPAARVEKPAKAKPRREVFSEDEVKRILAVIPETFTGRRDRALFELLYSSGLRLNEALSLCVEDIDFAHREIAVYHGKGGKERLAPVGRRALSALEIYLAERLKRRAVSPDLVFVSYRGKRLVTNDILRCLKKYKALAGVTNGGCTHAFRRSCATHLLAHGVPLPLIGRLLGHGTLETTRRYVRVETCDLRQVYKRSFKEDSDGIIGI